MNRHSAFIVAFILLAACSGDDDTGVPGGSGGIGGGSGGVGGMTGGMGGMTGGMGGMTGGMGGMTGGTGGMTGGMGGMTGGMGGMTGGMGGSGGMMDGGDVEPDDDGGVDDSGVDAEVDAEVDAGTDAGTDAGADAAVTYEEGAQNGACRTSGAECDDDLGCYPDGTSLPSFCTLTCADDQDCEDLTGATWTCWTGGGLCRVGCDPNNDNEDCPAGFECTDVAGMDRCMPIE